MVRITATSERRGGGWRRKWRPGTPELGSGSLVADDGFRSDESRGVLSEVPESTRFASFRRYAQDEGTKKATKRKVEQAD